MKVLGRVDDCIKKGLIRRIEPSRQTAIKMLEKAANLLKEAKSSLDANAPDGSVLMAYEVMLLSGKALLVKDGFRERSHYCVVGYVQEVYADKGKIKKSTVDLFDRYREIRHMVAYDAEFMVSEEDAMKAIEDAERLFTEIKKIINAGREI
ncbi:HEPN domain protein [mine drainage metagenome]|uniref:HEPN domain protein n=1 Tax=mine drainage metagenome TaxID=410659 RepID=T1ATF3_9ZZZZ